MVVCGARAGVDVVVVEVEGDAHGGQYSFFFCCCAARQASGGMTGTPEFRGGVLYVDVCLGWVLVVMVGLGTS